MEILFGGAVFLAGGIADASGLFTINITAPSGVSFDNTTNFSGTATLHGSTSEFGPNAYALFKVGGVVYNDPNAGIPNGTVMGGITVTLLEGLTIASTTVTDINGIYSFADIAPGTYTVEVTPVAGYLNVSSTDPTPSDGSTTFSITTANQNNVNFGLKRAPSATVVSETIPTPASGQTVTTQNPLTGTDPEEGDYAGNGASLIKPSIQIIGGSFTYGLK